ncbi:response regulator [Mucilaginibacter robiniae]|uniref:Response regulator n=1 Tax=Mucilaginibacter robiniae TaxID=2728022 RepID=A0A7L5DWM2_9SPHI|nr:response regulator [Mucilaginibacter robiniae]QJD95141.1 response regulator [Mucilaginibacter robiniae]
MKIVVVEDNPDIRDIIDYILKDDGYEVISSVDGSVVNQFSEVNPDLVLMDELLPGPRGSQLCQQIKSDEQTRHIPVVLVSTMPHLDKLAEKCGADGYLEKPFNISALVELIRKYAPLNGN